MASEGETRGEKNSFPCFTSVIHTLLTTEKKKREATSIQKVAVENFSSSSSVSIPLGLTYWRTTAPPKSCVVKVEVEKKKDEEDERTHSHTRNGQKGTLRTKAHKRGRERDGLFYEAVF